MATFMENLAANPSGSSGIYSSGGGGGDYSSEALGLYNQIKNREMEDFMRKANFMSDLSLKQDRLRKLYDPAQQQEQPQQPNVVMAHDPNMLTGYQRGELGIRQKQLEAEQQRIGQTGELGRQRLDIQRQKEQLDEQKNKQIHETKMADMQRKVEEANNKLGLAYDQLNNRASTAEQQIAAHKAIQDAMNERHKLELAHRDAQFEESKRLHDAQIKKMEDEMAARGRTRTTTRINPEGTERTTTTERGSAADTVRVVGKDGNTYEIPRDKLDDWNKNHAQEEQEEPQTKGGNGDGDE